MNVSYRKRGLKIIKYQLSMRRSKRKRKHDDLDTTVDIATVVRRIGPACSGP